MLHGVTRNFLDVESSDVSVTGCDTDVTRLGELTAGGAEIAEGHRREGLLVMSES